MEHRVGLRELNHRPGSVLRGIAEGDSLVVTENGVPRWRVTVYDGGNETLDELVRQGAVRPPRHDFEPPTPVRAASGRSSREILDELGADR